MAISLCVDYRGAADPAEDEAGPGHAAGPV